MFEIFEKIGQAKPFGLYITDSFVQVAQLGAKNGKVEISAAGQRPLPVGTVENGEIKNKKALADEIGALLKEAKPSPILEKDCIVAIPENQLFEYVFVLPATLKENELKAKIKELVTGTIPLQQNEILYRYIIETDEKNHLVHVYAAKKTVIVDYHDLIRNLCQLEARGYEPESIALTRCLSAKFTPKSGSILLYHRDEKLFWFSLIGDKAFESGIISIPTTPNATGQLLTELSESALTMDQKTGVEIKEIIVPEELQAILPDLQAGMNNAFPSTKITPEKYLLGNYHYKVSCALALKSFQPAQKLEINF